MAKWLNDDDWPGFERPLLYPKQRAAIYDPKRISCIEASTKAGKTAGCIIWLTEQATAGRPGWNYWWVGPTSDQASIAFNRMRHSLEPGTFIASLSHPQHITLQEGTTIWFKSGDKPNSLYGEDVYAAVVDEASRTKEDSWIALRSTLTYTRGPVRNIGNVHGRKNWFYRLCRLAERAQQMFPGGDPEIAYHKIIAHDAVEAGVLDAAEIEAARNQMPEVAWRELFLAEAADDGGNPFGIQHIAACIDQDGLSGNAPTAWGWDLGKHQDYTVGIAFDRVNHVCRFERWQGVPWDETLRRIVKMTAGCRGLVDSTGVGDPILDFLQRQTNNRLEGYHFTQTSKQRLMEGLAVAIQGHEIFYPDGVIKTELEQFEYEFTRIGVRYSAPEGFHDDCVCALALAVMCRTAVPQGIGPLITPTVLADIMRMPRRRIPGQ